jgi:hypothetical protein
MLGVHSAQENAAYLYRELMLQECPRQSKAYNLKNDHLLETVNMEMKSSNGFHQFALNGIQYLSTIYRYLSFSYWKSFFSLSVHKEKNDLNSTQSPPLVNQQKKLTCFKYKKMYAFRLLQLAQQVLCGHLSIYMHISHHSK